MDERYAEEAVAVVLSDHATRAERKEALRMILGLIEGDQGDWNDQTRRCEAIADLMFPRSDRLEAMRP